MTLNNIRASFGISSQATPTRAGVNGTATIGTTATNIALPTTANVAYQVHLVFANSSATADFNFETGEITATAWVPGSAQVETATAAGTITAAGNATVVVTADGMTGSPKTISVPVANGDTAATWAGKVRTALAADTAVAEKFTVSGATTSIVLTRKPTASYVVGIETVNVFRTNDTTLNISLTNGTCTGISNATTSSGTNGVASANVKLFNADQDFEGIAIPTITTIHAIGFENDGAGMASYAVDAGSGVAEAGGLGASAKRLFVNPANPGLFGSCTLSASGPTRLIVTIIGQTA